MLDYGMRNNLKNENRPFIEDSVENIGGSKA